MSTNLNGNIYPVWGINSENQVFAVDANNAVHVLSDANFAEVIAISESGIVWAISGVPDPSSGSVLYFSTGDGKWTALTNVPGAVILTGGNADGAVYATEDGQIWTVNTIGEGEQIANIQDLQELDYGGGNLWAVFPEKPGGPACLQFTSASQVPAVWKPFAGSPSVSGISANYSGDCYAASDYNPMYYSQDGQSSNSAGSGANGSTLALTFKNTFYLLSTSADENGNKVMIWVDEKGGVFQDAGFQAIQVLASYYLPSS
ncbi:MAG TPA: hypothetical protein PLO67_14240 [Saprospiraceae bacterium]|nr:hypothetical protein [Saprospiraceae bacterium]HPI06958.1 hypothetical protein [Saprospiraceae bacterium]